MSQIALGEVSWERMIRAVEKVRERLLRATSALEKARIQYAVAGGHAVAAWVSCVDEAAVRNTPDVDILLHRNDFDTARKVLAEVGFLHRQIEGVDIFLDGPGAKARDAVHLLFAGEKVRQADFAAAADLSESEAAPAFRIVTLEALVRMKLTSFRLKDRVHLQDMLEVGLIDATWRDRLPPALAARLQEILDNPEGQPT